MSQAGTLLREARRAVGMSQAALARAGGTSQAAVARYETGQVDPGIQTLERLVSALGMRLELRTVTRFPGPVGQILERRRVEVLAACRRQGASEPRVFGSVARGEDGPASDIDLLVELQPGRTLLDLEALQIELREILGVAVDVGTEEILRTGVSERVRADLTPL
jgi:predicted nucleotidyltransferase/DNA-binding XRE family transcriptional regulator